MSLKSKVKIDGTGLVVASIFYAVVGIVCFAVLAVVDFRLVHIGGIGVLSLLSFYGLLKSKKWTKWLVIVLFFVGTTFSVYTLYRAFLKNIWYNLILAGYLIATWIFTAYAVTKKGR